MTRIPGGAESVFVRKIKLHFKGLKFCREVCLKPNPTGSVTVKKKRKSDAFTTVGYMTGLRSWLCFKLRNTKLDSRQLLIFFKRPRIQVIVFSNQISV